MQLVEGVRGPRLGLLSDVTKVAASMVPEEEGILTMAVTVNCYVLDREGVVQSLEKWQEAVGREEQGVGVNLILEDQLPRQASGNHEM